MVATDTLAPSARRIDAHPLLEPARPTRPVTIDFDGRPLPAFEGDSLAAALLAAGVRVFRTMPRTGEARGGYCFVGRCADCALTVDGELNVRACVTPVRDGMKVVTQHGLGAWSEAESG